MRNVHERVIAAAPEQVGALLDTLGSRHDRFWPGAPRVPMVLRGPAGGGLGAGARGGHGSVRYAVEEHRPGRRVAFRFEGALPLHGTHVLTVDPAPGGTLVRHDMVATPSGALRLLWPLLVRSMHDCYVEDAFDRVERELGVGPVREHRHSRWTALERARRHVRPADPRLDGLGSGGLARVDAADAFRTDLLPGDGVDPLAWTHDVFASAPGWVRAAMALRDRLVRPLGLRAARGPDERPLPVLAVAPTAGVRGLDDRHLELRVVTSVDERRAEVTLTTLVQVHSGLGPAYWGVVRHVHPVVVRVLLRRTGRPAGAVTAVVPAGAGGPEAMAAAGSRPA